MLFKLLGGQHADGCNIYVKGDVIESDRDLTKVFKGKFQRLHDDEIGPKVKDKFKNQKEGIIQPAIPMDTSSDEDEEKVTDDEEIVDTDDSLSDSLEDDKEDEEEEDEDVEDDEDVDDEEDDDEEDDEEEEKVDHGKNVTRLYPKAKKANVSVFRKGNWYTVVDNEDNEVLHEKKLRKEGVVKFLKTYLKG